MQLGSIVKRQALVMGFSDTFAVIGVLLAVAAIALLFARKASGARRGRGALSDAAPQPSRPCDPIRLTRASVTRSRISPSRMSRKAIAVLDRRSSASTG